MPRQLIAVSIVTSCGWCLVSCDGELSCPVTRVWAGAESTCATTADGKLWCWGGNRNTFQVGDGTTIDRHRPVEPKGDLAYVTAISIGLIDTCAIESSGFDGLSLKRFVRGHVSDGFRFLRACTRGYDRPRQSRAFLRGTIG
jgi:Regulator of chromosome condensation (RCC1) repeat